MSNPREVLLSKGSSSRTGSKLIYRISLMKQRAKADGFKHDNCMKYNSYWDKFENIGCKLSKPQANKTQF